MDLTDDQIIEEFKRQVRLCSGIGIDKMLDIVNAQFGVNSKKAHKWQFYMNGTFCTRCNRSIGTKEDCDG